MFVFFGETMILYWLAPFFFGWDDNILADSTINYHHLLVGGIPTSLKNDRVRQLG